MMLVNRKHATDIVQIPKPSRGIWYSCSLYLALQSFKDSCQKRGWGGGGRKELLFYTHVALCLKCVCMWAFLAVYMASTCVHRRSSVPLPPLSPVPPLTSPNVYQSRAARGPPLRRALQNKRTSIGFAGGHGRQSTAFMSKIHAVFLEQIWRLKKTIPVDERDVWQFRLLLRWFFKLESSDKVGISASSWSQISKIILIIWAS